MKSSILGYSGSLFRTIAHFSSSVPRLPGAKHSLIRFDPEFFSRDARVIIPISFSRYVVDGKISAKRATEYDHFLSALFERTSFFLDAGIIASVDVLATGDLQRINWSDSLADSIEQHFFEVHQDLLLRQSNAYKWSQWITLQGNQVFEKAYQEIVSQSQPGSHWYNLMGKTHESVKISGEIELSLEYQRREYAAISLMSKYTHLVYPGRISTAWAYLYNKCNGLPIFSQVKLETTNSNSYIDSYDVDHTTRMLLSNVKQVLTSRNFPPKSKEAFIDEIIGLIYTYQSSEGEHPAIDDIISNSESKKTTSPR